jgi:hypothetical protein
MTSKACSPKKSARSSIPYFLSFGLDITVFSPLNDELILSVFVSSCFLQALVALFKSDIDPQLGLYGSFGYDLTFQFEPIKYYCLVNLCS